MLIPENLTRAECFSIYSTLISIRGKILTGEPSGKVIDRAIEEVLNQAGQVTFRQD